MPLFAFFKTLANRYIIKTSQIKLDKEDCVLSLVARLRAL